MIVAFGDPEREFLEEAFAIAPAAKGGIAKHRVVKIGEGINEVRLSLTPICSLINIHL